MVFSWSSAVIWERWGSESASKEGGVELKTCLSRSVVMTSSQQGGKWSRSSVSSVKTPDLWSGQQPEQIQGYVLPAQSKMLSDPDDNWIGWRPLSHRRTLLSRAPAFKGFIRFQLPSILFKGLHSVPLLRSSGSCVVVHWPDMHFQPKRLAGQGAKNLPGPELW